MILVILFFILEFIHFSSASHHWIVTESGRIEPKLDSAFPVKRPYDLLSVLEQEQRLHDVREMHQKLLKFKNSVDEQWSSIELETELENRLYSTDPNCIYAEHPLSRFRLHPAFFDVPNPASDRPKTKGEQQPPDCKKFSKLDFTMVTLPHLDIMRNHGNITGMFDDVDSDIDLRVDINALLTKNKSDWTAYNLAVNYWHMHQNASNAIECARRAIYFAPRFWKYLALFNLGSLLLAMQRLGEAAIVLHMAVDMDRRQFRSHVALGDVYTHLSDYPRAAGCYENALSLRPDVALLAKQRAAVLCHQTLINGLWAIDAALKRIVEELQEYSQLQERWMLTHTKIGLERASGVSMTPSSDNLKTLWKAVEQQTLLLSERMIQTKTPLSSNAVASNSIPKVVLPSLREWDPFKTEPIENHQERCAARGTTDQTFLKKVKEFYEFMTEMTCDGKETTKEEIIEKLVRLEGNHKGHQPPESPYWKTLSKCLSLLVKDQFTDECGRLIFVEYLNRMNDQNSKPDSSHGASESPEDLLDESIIENYVHDRNMLNSDKYHDISEL